MALSLKNPTTMKIQLTPQESIDIFYDALCNGLAYVCSGYGLDFTFSDKEYEISRKNLLAEKPTEVPCYEDILIQMLRDGYKLTIVDIEGKGAYTKSIAIKDVYARVKKTPLKHLTDHIEENGDAITADAIIQTVFFKEIIFG